MPNDCINWKMAVKLIPSHPHCKDIVTTFKSPLYLYIQVSKAYLVVWFYLTAAVEIYCKNSLLSFCFLFHSSVVCSNRNWKGRSRSKLPWRTKKKNADTEINIFLKISFISFKIILCLDYFRIKCCFINRKLYFTPQCEFLSRYMYIWHRHSGLPSISGRALFDSVSFLDYSSMIVIVRNTTVWPMIY